MTAVPTSLVRFQQELEGAIRRDRAQRRRRGVVRGTVAVAATAAVALGALGALPRTGPSVVERAAAALRAVDDGTVLHTVLVGTLTGTNGQMDVRIETWEASSPPYDQLQIYAAGGRRFEVARVSGVDQLYDPQTNTIYEDSSQPTDAGSVPKARASKWKEAAPNAGSSGKESGAIGDSYRAKILGLLDSGTVHQAGRETINGRDAIRLVSDDGTVTLLVDADSYEPIEWRVNQGGREAVTSFPVYEHLPATDANAALLSLTQRHPDAAVDDDSAHYRAALERLNPKLR